MRFSTLILLSLVVVGTVSCRKQDIRTARIHVPQMASELCADRAVAVVRQVPGVFGDQVVVDRVRRDVAVPYDSLKLSLKNIEYALAKAGFQANNIPADEQARAALPESCR